MTLFNACLCGPRKRSEHRQTVTDAGSGRDPTGTYRLRRSFRAELDKRWQKLAQLLREGIADHDLLGLRGATVVSINFSSRAPHPTLPHGDKVAGFKSWLGEAIRQTVLGDERWTAPFVLAAVSSARTRAFDLAKQNAVGSTDRVQVLQSMVISELHGIVAAVQQQAVRAVAHDILARKRPAQIAKDVVAVVRTVGKKRSRAMAEYMIVKSHASATLDAFRSLGFRKVGLIAERIGRKTTRDDWSEAAREASLEVRRANAKGADEKVVAYHGTTADLTTRIQKEGLKISPGAPRMVDSFYLYQGDRGHSVFVTTSEADAKKYAMLRVTKDETDKLQPAVVELHVPEKEWKNFKADLIDNKPVNIGGKETAGAHYTTRNIPPAWIKGVRTYDRNRLFKEVSDAKPDHVAFVVIMVKPPTTDALVIDRPPVAGPGSRSSREETPSARVIGEIEKAQARLEAMGEVDVLTAGDNDVCQDCQDISDSGPYDIDEAESLIPAHPWCRCAFVPAGTLEDAAAIEAAGVMFQTPEGRMLLMHRTDKEGWAFPAGGLEDDETWQHAAQREAAEETGYPGDWQIEHIDSRETNGVLFHTFRQPVDAVFTPIMNEEHDDFGWFLPSQLNTLVNRVHPGVMATLRAKEMLDAGEWTEELHPRGEHGHFVESGSRQDQPTGKGETIRKLAERPEGVSRKELIEATGWSQQAWKWYFENSHNTGFCQRFGYKLHTIEGKSGETRYRIEKIENWKREDRKPVEPKAPVERKEGPAKESSGRSLKVSGGDASQRFKDNIQSHLDRVPPKIAALLGKPTTKNGFAPPPVKVEALSEFRTSDFPRVALAPGESMSGNYIGMWSEVSINKETLGIDRKATFFEKNMAWSSDREVHNTVLHELFHGVDYRGAGRFGRLKSEQPMFKRAFREDMRQLKLRTDGASLKASYLHWTTRSEAYAEVNARILNGDKEHPILAKLYPNVTALQTSWLKGKGLIPK